MAELKDDITEERRILKEAGILDEKLLEKMDIFPGDRVRFRFYYHHSGFEEMIGHFLGLHAVRGPRGRGRPEPGHPDCQGRPDDGRLQGPELPRGVRDPRTEPEGPGQDPRFGRPPRPARRARIRVTK